MTRILTIWNLSRCRDGAPLLGHLGGALDLERTPRCLLHADNERRLAALDRVATSLGATRNQVVLAWLMGGSPAVTPIVGVSSVAQLDEITAARDVRLDADDLAVLNSVS